MRCDCKASLSLRFHFLSGATQKSTYTPLYPHRKSQKHTHLLLCLNNAMEYSLEVGPLHSLTSSPVALVVQSLNHVQLFSTLWTVPYQAPLFMGFPRQEYWSGLPFPSPRYPPDSGIKTGFATLQEVSCIAGRSFIDQESPLQVYRVN